MKQQTCASLVLETLRTLDEFVTGKQIMELTGLNSNQVSATLVHLRKYGCIDVVIQDGLGWWYAVPNAGHTPRAEQEERSPRKRKPGYRKLQGPKINRFGGVK